MNRRKRNEQRDLLDDITKLSQFPRRKARPTTDFDGPRNPREVRALRALLKSHLTRESLDAIAGASNGPELINQLRDRGLALPCFRLGSLDRDGVWVHRGLYALTHRDKTKVARALAGGGAGNATTGDNGQSKDDDTRGGRHAKR